MVRKYANRLIDLVDEGLFDKDILIAELVNQLSDYAIEKFVKREGYYGFEDLDPEYLAHLEDQAQEDSYMRQFDETAAWYDTSAELM